MIQKKKEKKNPDRLTHNKDIQGFKKKRPIMV